MIYMKENIFLTKDYKKMCFSFFPPWLLGDSELNLKSILAWWLILYVNVAKP